MTSRSMLRIAPLLAALLTTAGCPLDLAQYEPKTDLQCGGWDTGLKACGYRCMPIDDPATGCWESEVEGVCNPCPLPTAAQEHAFAACETVTYTYPICGLACAAGWGDCNGDPSNGCETDLTTTAAHCGACGHACATTCTNGVCAPETFATLGLGAPVDIDQAGGKVFVIDSGGALRDAANSAGALASGLGAVKRLRMVSATEGWILGSWVSGSLYDAIWHYPDDSDGTPWVTDTGIVDFTLTYSDSVPGATAWVAWVTSDYGGIETVSTTNEFANGPWIEEGRFFTTVEGDPTGGDIAFTGEASGDLKVHDSSTYSGLGGFAPPTRLAAYVDGSGFVTVFSASAADGSVSIWSKGNYIDRVIPGDGPTTKMDIHADADGVYWTDETAGVVRMWRASDEFVFDLARGGQPVAVTSDAGNVYWADTADDTIRSLPK
jgi:hypothetical protein